MAFDRKLRQQVGELRAQGFTPEERRRLFRVSKTNRDIQEGETQKNRLDFTRWLREHGKLES